MRAWLCLALVFIAVAAAGLLGVGRWKAPVAAGPLPRGGGASAAARAPEPHASSHDLVLPGPIQVRSEVAPERAAAQAEAQTPAPAAPDPLEVKYGGLDVDQLRGAIERLRVEQSRARLSAAALEARGDPGLTAGPDGGKMRMGFDGLTETYAVHRPQRGTWEDVTWLVERDPAVQVLHAESLWLQARIARLEGGGSGER